MVLDLASHCSHMDIIIIMVAPTQEPGVDVLSWRKLTVVPGALLFLKSQAISMNPGGHAGLFSAGLSWGVNTHAKAVCQLGVAGVEVVTATIVDRMMRAWNIPEKGWPIRNPGVRPSASWPCPTPPWLSIAPLPLTWHLLMTLFSSTVREDHC